MPKHRHRVAHSNITDATPIASGQADANPPDNRPRHDRQPHRNRVSETGMSSAPQYAAGFGQGEVMEHSCGRQSVGVLHLQACARGPSVSNSLPRCGHPGLPAPVRLVSSYSAARRLASQMCCDLVEQQQRGARQIQRPSAGVWQGSSDTSRRLLLLRLTIARGDIFSAIDALQGRHDAGPINVRPAERSRMRLIAKRLTQARRRFLACTKISQVWAVGTAVSALAPCAS